MKTLYYIYIKISEDKNWISDFLSKNEINPEDCRSYIDTSRDFIHYKDMKCSILEEKGNLIISSLHSLGDTKESIQKELIWCSKNNIPLIVYDMPSTWIFDNQKLNSQSINTMIDLFDLLKQYSNFEFQNPVFLDGGRKKIKFPENWESLYKLYELKQITANEFQQRVGLKRATFFNLLSEYKQLLKLNNLELFKTESLEFDI